MFAGAIFAGLLGTVYAAAAADDAGDADPLRVVSVPAPEVVTAAERPPAEEPIPTGHEVPEAIGAMLDAERDGEILDPETGVRVGPLTVLPAPDAIEPVEPELVEPAAPPSRSAPRRRAARRTPAPVSVTRLHPDPGRNVILTARQMMARNDVVQGSCYRYISEVFARAGHTGWRTRRVVYQGRRTGPYADLDLIRPGDWLYIVNHPERTPVGTHSVLFVGWQDRARGYARVIEHSGWGAPSAGQERGYDVSRTYRITRPIRAR